MEVQSLWVSSPEPRPACPLRIEARQGSTAENQNILAWLAAWVDSDYDDSSEFIKDSVWNAEDRE
jgi:hypothetical protein